GAQRGVVRLPEARAVEREGRGRRCGELHMQVGEDRMTSLTRAGTALCLIFCTLITLESNAAPQDSSAATQEIVKIWPGKPPGTEDWTKAESIEQTVVPDAGRAVQIIKNVA